MAGYVRPALVTDADTIIADAFDRLTSNIPGYVPRDSPLVSWLFEVLGRMVAEGRDVASVVFDDIFRYFGQSMLGIPPVASAPATANTTWTMIDAAGYTIPEGTVVAYRTAGDTLVPFLTTAEVVVAPGALTTLAGEVTIQAVEPGDAGNGLGPAGLELVDALAYVEDLVAVAATAGGVDAETDEAYLDRLNSELRLLAPRPILPEDFAVFARRVPGVHRALAINGYNPDTATYDNERTVAVAVVDADGAAVALAVKNAVEATLEAEREVNFVIKVMDPTYTVVNVNFTVKVADLYTAADVVDAAELAVAAYISPAVWGGGDESPPAWRPGGTVRYLEVAEVINRVAGVDYITALTLNGVAGDVALAGVAPLPTTGAVVGAAA